MTLVGSSTGGGATPIAGLGGTMTLGEETTEGKLVSSLSSTGASPKVFKSTSVM